MTSQSPCIYFHPELDLFSRILGVINAPLSPPFILEITWLLLKRPHIEYVHTDASPAVISLAGSSFRLDPRLTRSQSPRKSGKKQEVEQHVIRCVRVYAVPSDFL